MARNNQRRTRSAPKNETSKVTTKSSVLDFVSPTEYVDLPSQGRFYEEGHPFHNLDTIEIRYMTAKDEDILTNQTLLRKGIALEKLLENILGNYEVDPGTLLIGDRNAIIVAARSTGYGSSYTTSVTCPACQATTKLAFNLDDVQVNNGNTEGVVVTDRGTFEVELPLTKVTAEVRLLNGEDERELAREISNKKSDIWESLHTSQLERMIVSLNGETARDVINKFVELMPAHDSRRLREAHESLTPSIDFSHNFECNECGHEQKLGVPFTVDFFWPNR